MVEHKLEYRTHLTSKGHGSGLTTQHTPCLVQPVSAHIDEVMYFWSGCFRGELGFLNCDDICMRVVNKQFELLEFVFDSVYVDL